MSLFNRGLFTLSSGKQSNYKIDCDALSDDDIDTVAYLLSLLVKPFGYVEGVPMGGLRLAKAMVNYISSNSNSLLIVDDVWTTGGSVKKHLNGREGQVAVIFMRGKATEEVTSLFNINDGLKDESLRGRN